MNNSSIELSPSMVLNYAGSIELNGKAIHKYNIVLKNGTLEETISVFSGSNFLEDSFDKEKLAEAILSEIHNTNSKDIYIGDAVVKNNSITFKKDSSVQSNLENARTASNASAQNDAQTVQQTSKDTSIRGNRAFTQQTNNVQSTTTVSSTSGGSYSAFTLASYEEFDNALTTIRTLNTNGICDDVMSEAKKIQMAANEIPSKYVSPEVAVNAVNSIINSQYENITKLSEGYEGIFTSLLSAYTAEHTLMLEQGKIKLDDDCKDLFDENEFLGEHRKIKSKYENNGYTTLSEYFGELSAVNSHYSVINTSEAKEMLSSKNSINIDQIYESLHSTSGMSRETFDNLLANNIDELAKQISEFSVNSVLNGGSANSIFVGIQNDYYCTEEGQKQLLKSFIDSSGAEYDNAIGYTNYIQWCMASGHTQDWLIQELRAIPTIVTKINSDSNFSSQVEITDATLIEQLKSYDMLPYNYFEKDGKYYKTTYNMFGKQMLYYMDYHWGENVGNVGDDRIITAFSEQGYIDAVGRNYKGAWINSHQDYADAERDYEILNGNIKDEERLDELLQDGNIAFADMVSYLNALDGDYSKLLDGDYLKDHESEIIEQTGLTKNQLYNFSTKSLVGDILIDGTVKTFASLGCASVQLVSGLVKFGENVVDAARVTAHSDFFESMFVNGSFIDVSGLKEIKNVYDELYQICIDDLKRTGRYDSEYERYINSDAAKKALLAKFNEKYLDSTTGMYYIPGYIGSQLDIPQDVYEKEIEQFKETVFKEYLVNEYGLYARSDASSSSLYTAAFKLGIRNGGDFSYFDSLSDNLVRKANKQFDAMIDISEDWTGSLMQQVYDLEWYNTIEDYSFVKKDNIAGVVFNQVGNMAVPILANFIPGVGNIASSALLWASAFGGAAEESINSGGTYNETLKYSLMSATTELAIEWVFGGIGGIGTGWLDNALNFPLNKLLGASGLTNNAAAQIAKKLITNGIGEGIEEVVTDFVTPLWQSLTFDRERSYDEIKRANVSKASLTETFLVSFMSSMIFGGGNIRSQVKLFNNSMNNLTQLIGDVPGMKEYANAALAAMISSEANGANPSVEIFNRIIEQCSIEMAKNPQLVEGLQTIQTQLIQERNNLQEQEVTIKYGDEEISIPKATLLMLTDSLNLKINEDLTVSEDGVVTYNSEINRDNFIRTIYKNAESQHKALAKMYKRNIAKYKLESALGLNTNLQNVIDELSNLGQYNMLHNSGEVLEFEYKGQKYNIPMNALIEATMGTNLQSKYSFNETSTEVTFKEGFETEFVKTIYAKAINAMETQKTAYEGARENFHDAFKNKDFSRISDAVRTITTINEETMIITDVEEVKDKDLIRLEITTYVDGQETKVNAYVDSKTKSYMFENTKLLMMKVQELVSETGATNVYLGTITDGLGIFNGTIEHTLKYNMNEEMQNYVDSLNIEEKTDVSEEFSNLETEQQQRSDNMTERHKAEINELNRTIEEERRTFEEEYQEKVKNADIVEKYALDQDRVTFERKAQERIEKLVEQQNEERAELYKQNLREKLELQVRERTNVPDSEKTITELQIERELLRSKETLTEAEQQREQELNNVIAAKIAEESVERTNESSESSAQDVVASTVAGAVSGTASNVIIQTETNNGTVPNNQTTTQTVNGQTINVNEVLKAFNWDLNELNNIKVTLTEAIKNRDISAIEVSRTKLNEILTKMDSYVSQIDKVLRFEPNSEISLAVKEFNSALKEFNAFEIVNENINDINNSYEKLMNSFEKVNVEINNEVSKFNGEVNFDRVNSETGVITNEDTMVVDENIDGIVETVSTEEVVDDAAIIEEDTDTTVERKSSEVTINTSDDIYGVDAPTEINYDFVKHYLLYDADYESKLKFVQNSQVKEIILNEYTKDDFSNLLESDYDGQIIIKLLDKEGCKILSGYDNLTDRINYLFAISKAKNDLLNQEYFCKFILENINKIGITMTHIDVINNKFFLDYVAKAVGKNGISLQKFSTLRSSALNYVAKNKDLSIRQIEENIGIFSKESIEWLFNNRNINIKNVSDSNIAQILKSGAVLPDAIFTKDFIGELLENNGLYKVRLLIEQYSKNADSSVVNEKLKQIERGFIDNVDSKTGILAKYNTLLKEIMEGQFGNAWKYDFTKELRADLDKAIRNNDIDKISDIIYKQSQIELADIIIDYHFNDVSYNVFIDIKELLNFQVSNPDVLLSENLELYKNILNIDKLSLEEKLKLHDILSTKNIVAEFYDDMSNAIMLMNKQIADSIITHEKIQEFKNLELSNKYGVPVYKFTGEDFYALTKSGNHPNGENPHGRSYSLTGRGAIQTFDNASFGKTFVYEGLIPNQIIHIYPHDSFTSYSRNDGSTDRVRVLMTPNELLSNTTGYNELLILEHGTIASDIDSKAPLLKPIALYCLDEVTPELIEKAKANNVGIMLIDSEAYFNSDESHARLDLKDIDYMKYTYFDLSNKEQFENNRDNITSFEKIDQLDEIIKSKTEVVVHEDSITIENIDQTIVEELKSITLPSDVTISVERVTNLFNDTKELGDALVSGRFEGNNIVDVFKAIKEAQLKGVKIELNGAMQYLVDTYALLDEGKILFNPIEVLNGNAPIEVPTTINGIDTIEVYAAIQDGSRVLIEKIGNDPKLKQDYISVLQTMLNGEVGDVYSSDIVKLLSEVGNVEVYGVVNNTVFVGSEMHSLDSVLNELNNDSMSVLEISDFDKILKVLADARERGVSLKLTNRSEHILDAFKNLQPGEMLFNLSEVIDGQDALVVPADIVEKYGEEFIKSAIINSGQSYFTVSINGELLQQFANEEFIRGKYVYESYEMMDRLVKIENGLPIRFDNIKISDLIDFINGQTTKLGESYVNAILELYNYVKTETMNNEILSRQELKSFGKISSISDLLKYNNIGNISVTDILKTIKVLQSNGVNIVLNENIQNLIDVVSSLKEGEILFNTVAVYEGNNPIILSAEVVNKYGAEFINDVKSAIENNQYIIFNHSTISSFINEEGIKGNYILDKNGRLIRLENGIPTVFENVELSNLFGFLSTDMYSRNLEFRYSDSRYLRAVNELLNFVNDNNVTYAVKGRKGLIYFNSAFEKITSPSTSAVLNIDLVSFNKLRTLNTLTGNSNLTIINIHEYLNTGASPIMLPKSVIIDNGIIVKVEEIIDFMQKPISELNKAINTDEATRYAYARAIKAMQEITTDETSLELLNQYAERLGSNNKQVRDVRSKMHEAFTEDRNISSTFGTNQGAIRNLLKRMEIGKTFMEFLGEEVTDEQFLRKVSELKISDKQFMRILEEQGLFNSSFANDLKTLKRLIKTVQNVYPDMSAVDSIRLLYLMETTEAGGKGICNYASVTNLIINKFIGNEKLFEDKFGYPLYIEVNGKKVLNSQQLLVDLYATVNKGVLVEDIGKYAEKGLFNYKYKNAYTIASNNENYIHLNGHTKLNETVINSFFESKEIDLELSSKFSFVNETDISYYEDVLAKIAEELQKGHDVQIAGFGMDIYELDGRMHTRDCGGHIMSVVGIDSNGRLIVDSWGKELVIDLKKEIARCGEKYNPTREGKYDIRSMEVFSYDLVSKSEVGLKPISHIQSDMDTANLNTTQSEKDSTYDDTNSNVELKKVSELNMNSGGLLSKTFNYNRSYIGYDYVARPKTALSEAIDTIISSNIDGKVLIEIPNTLELNFDLISKLPDNVEIRVIGGYSNSYLNAIANGDDAVAFLKKATYTKEQLLKINEELEKFDSLVNPNWTDMEKAKFIYNYLSNENNIKYNPKPYGGNQFRPAQFDGLMSLVEKESTCNGYAYTYQVLAERLGLECYELSGVLSVTPTTKAGNGHAFNAVVIDGKTFLVDTVRKYQNAPFNIGTGFGVKSVPEYNIRNQVISESDINYHTEEALEASKESDSTSNIELARNNASKDKSLSDMKFIRELDKVYDPNLTVTKIVKKMLNKFAPTYSEENLDKVENIYKYLSKKRSKKAVAEEIRKYYQSKLDDRGFDIYEHDGVLIKVIKGIDTSAQVYTVEYVKSQLDQLKALYGRVDLKEVIIYDSKCPSNCVFDEKYKMNGFDALAEAKIEDGVIALFATKKIDDRTIYHEYAHMIAKDLVNQNPNVSSEWIDAINADGGFVNSYAERNVEEDFAESIAYYLDNPSTFKRLFPNRAKFIEKYLNTNGIDINKSGQTIEKIKLKAKVKDGNISNESFVAKIEELDRHYIITDNSIQVGEITLTFDGIKETFSDGYSIIQLLKNGKNGLSTIDYFKAINYLTENGYSLDLRPRVIQFAKKVSNIPSDLIVIELTESYLYDLDIMTIDETLVEKYGRDFIEKFVINLDTSNVERDSLKEQAYEKARSEFLNEDAIRGKYVIIDNKPVRLKNDIPYKFGFNNTTRIIDALQNGKVETHMFDDILNFVKYIKENNVTLNLNETASTILEKLKAVTNDSSIVNLESVLNENAIPIVVPNEIRVGDKLIETSEILKVLTNKYNSLYSSMSSLWGTINSKNIHEVLDSFFSYNEELRNMFADSVRLIEQCKKSYIFKTKINGYTTYLLLDPNFKNMKTSDIVELINYSDNSVINRVINLSFEERQKVLETLYEFESYIKAKEPNIEIKVDSRIIEELNNTMGFKPEEVRSSLQSLFERIRANHGNYGTKQGIIRELIEKIGVHDVIEVIFGNTIENDVFLETLEQMQISDEELSDLLSSQVDSVTGAVYSGNIDLEVYNTLIKQVQINFPGMSFKEATRVLFLLETSESKCGGICNYASVANMIIKEFMGKEALFEEKFGYPMYIETVNGKVLNDARLLVDMFTTINSGLLFKMEDGKYIIANSSEQYINLAAYWEQTNSFLMKKGIPIKFNRSFDVSSSWNVMKYNSVMNSIKEALLNGKNVMISGSGLDLISDGDVRLDRGGHIMTVVGIDSNGNLIVDSWGKEFTIDLRKEILRTGQKFISHGEGNTDTRNIAISIYEAVDSSSSTSDTTSATTTMFDSDINLNRSEQTSQLERNSTFEEDKEFDNAINEKREVLVSKYAMTASEVILPEWFQTEFSSQSTQSILDDLIKGDMSEDVDYCYIEFAKYVVQNNIDLNVNDNVKKAINMLADMNEGEICYNINDVIDEGDDPLIFPAKFGYSNTINLLDRLLEGDIRLVDQGDVVKLAKYLKEHNILIVDNNLKKAIDVLANMGEDKVCYNINDVIGEGSNPIILPAVFGNSWTMSLLADMQCGSAPNDLSDAVKLAKYILTQNMQSNFNEKTREIIDKLISISEIIGEESSINIENIIFSYKLIDLICNLQNGDINLAELADIVKLAKYFAANNIELNFNDNVKKAIDILANMAEGNICFNINDVINKGVAPIIIPNKIGTVDVSVLLSKLAKGFIQPKELSYIVKLAKYFAANNIKLNFNDNVKKAMNILANIAEGNICFNINDVINKGVAPIIIPNYIESIDVGVLLSRLVKGSIQPEELCDIVKLAKYLTEHNLHLNFDDNISDTLKALSSVDSTVIGFYSNNMTEINRYINADLQTRLDVFKKIKAFEEHIKHINPSIKIDSRIIEELNNNIEFTPIETRSTLQGLFERIRDNQGNYGTEQSIVRELIEKIGVHNAIEKAFGNPIKNDVFLETLEQMQISDEQLRDLLSSQQVESITSAVYSGNIDLEVYNTLIEQVQINFPGMSFKDAIRTLFLLETKESKCGGICNYASAANMIIKEFMGKETLFEEKFGYPMYIETVNGKVLNDARLLVDMFTTINSGDLFKMEDGAYIVANSSEEYVNLAARWQEINSFLAKKGVSFKFDRTFDVSSRYGIMKYDVVMQNIREALLNGKNVMISGVDFEIASKTDDSQIYLGFGHIMTVVGIDSNGYLIVDSWGREFTIDLKNVLLRCDHSLLSHVNIDIYEVVDSNSDIIQDKNQ